MSEEVIDRVRRAIEDHGPITFAEFMEIALYGPEGFYEQPPIGERGHFLTSPHVHPVFGRLLAGAVRTMWEELGRPDPFTVVEAGAGDGTLARQLLDALGAGPIRYVAVERSSGARSRLGELRLRVLERLTDLGDVLVGCVLANELLDNLPFRRVRRTDEGLFEVLVGLTDGRFEETESPCGEDLEGLTPELRPGQEAAVSDAALGFISEILQVLSQGYALLIDYGEGPTAPVHGYRRHRVIADVLAEPGTTDITAGVDFDALARRAKSSGLDSLGPFPQRAALSALGFARWIDEERTRQGELLRSGSGLEAVRAFGGRSRASLLMDPAGLGGLEWLLLATPGSSWPEWAIHAAAE